MKYVDLTKELIEKGKTDFGALCDGFEMLRGVKDAGGVPERDLMQMGWNIRNLSLTFLRQNGSDAADLYKKALLFNAVRSFDDYMIYLEFQRPKEEQFYLPRRKVLKPLIDALQALSDDELDELFLSEPPRVGKSTALMFYATWIIGKWPEKSNLYCAFSDIITNAFYTGVLEILRDPYTYQWHDIFPDSRIAATNSKDETLDIDRVKRYKTLTCRSLYGTLNGACDCNGILISDDLIGGIEEAMNKDRMVSAWTKVDNNLLPRAKEKAKLLWCGTRWSMIDPAGLRMNLLKSEPKFANRRVKIINLPALNEKDESNFDYLYGVGFSTDFYQQRRASFERNNDMASWLAQYQGEPIERQGALFEPEDMKTYNGILPDEKDLVRIFMAVDPAYGGGDFTASPVCYQYVDGSVYVADVVYSDGDKKVTIPLLVSAVEKYKVQAVQIEANKATLGYTEELDRELRKKNLKVNVTTALAPNNMAKETRIYDKAPEIREFCFLDEGKRSKEYNRFMTNVYSFTLTGKNKHDDAPDSLAMAVDMLQSTARKAEIFSRPYR